MAAIANKLIATFDLEELNLAAIAAAVWANGAPDALTSHGT